ncbi:hypothetical protein FF38_03215 [Lucilia cuprina]|uniref:Uncharacterized protein n=1 Tax=Lucilia cuprina TaxID=7375 RepID=A0A0L0BP65_LUCCU|nr:hypothetical protein FF38_03215 [Lucilia cuprina]
MKKARYPKTCVTYLLLFVNGVRTFSQWRNFGATSIPRVAAVNMVSYLYGDVISFQYITNDVTKCNILGLSYRSISILIASVLIIQDVCYIISFMLKTKISCHIFNNGLYSLVIQFGDDYWSLAGLLIAILCLVTNTALLVGSIWKNNVVMKVVDFYVTFIFKIQLFYEYVKYLKRPRLTTFSGNEMFNRSSFFRRSSSVNI